MKFQMARLKKTFKDKMCNETKTLEKMELLLFKW